MFLFLFHLPKQFFMAANEFLKITASDNEDVLVSVQDKMITIQNTSDDATYWTTNISLGDFEQIIKFVYSKIN